MKQLDCVEENYRYRQHAAEKLGHLDSWEYKGVYLFPLSVLGMNANIVWCRAQGMRSVALSAAGTAGAFSNTFPTCQI